MDISQLSGIATQVSVFLAPFLPSILLVSKEAGKEVGQELGEATIKIARKIWGTLKEAGFDKNKKLIKSAYDLAEFPDDEDFKLKLAKELTIELEHNATVAESLLHLLTRNKTAVQEVLINNQSQANNIQLRIKQSIGKQKVEVDNSIVGDINIEQGS